MMPYLRRTGYTADNGVFYLLQDHLHSSSALLTQAGALATGGRAYYLPFGGVRSGQVNLTAKRFTGQYHEASLPGGEGLYDYGARWYDARLGRFVSPDSLVPNPANPQDLNRFSYVRNNPLKFTDPTGHYSDDQIMQHFGCKTWGCVEANFMRGGKLAGLWGWLKILRGAIDGDRVDTMNWTGAGVNVAIGAMHGVFQFVGGSIYLVDASIQSDTQRPNSGLSYAWDKLDATTFGRLAAYPDASKGPADGFYYDKSGGNGIATFGDHALDCQHHDCVTQTLDAASTALTGTAWACGAAGVAPCVFGARVAGGLVTIVSSYRTVRNVALGDETVSGGLVTGALTIAGQSQDSRKALAANVAQWIWDTIR